MTESVPRIVDMSEIGPHVIDAVWTDGYGREYHVVGRERLTAAEDEIASLTIERDEALARVEKLESQRTTWRHLYEGAAESRDEGYKLAEEVAAQLPTPDATNPVHLRWAADLLWDNDPDNHALQRTTAAVLRDQAALLADEAVRAEVERVAIETTDVVLDKLAAAIVPAMDVEAAKASMRPAIRDAVDAVLADLRGGDEQ